MIRSMVLVMLLAGGALAQSVQVDGQALPEAVPVRSGQRLLVPMRSIFEALGATLDVQGTRILAKRGDSKMEVRLNSNLALVNGRSVVLEEPARLVGGKTMVPLRFVAEALGAKVTYTSGLVSIVTVADAPLPMVIGGEDWSGPYTFDAARDLKRLRVGNQASILKVMDSANAHEQVHRGLDDRNAAQFTGPQRAEIFAALGVPSAELPRAAEAVMKGYAFLPKREALAFLGAVGSHPGLDAGYRARVEEFVVARLAEKDVVLRRQALLALAVMAHPNATTVERVLSFYERSENLWETFPVQMFFEFHASEIRGSNSFASIHHRVEAVNSLYRQNILGYLER